MVSIIILSYNTKDLLEQCLNSVFTHFDHESMEVIVVDNASTDNSVSTIKNKFKKVQLIESKKNLGFSAGVNRGVAIAKGDILLCLNSDTIIQKGSLKNIENLFFSNKKIGVVGGVQVDVHGKVRVSSGKIYNILSVLFPSLSFVSSSKEFFANKSKEVEWVNGACLFITKDLFKKIGGFDEHFFMYMEDMELCYRVRKLGHTVTLLSDFVVSHLELGSSNRGFAVVEIYKGILYFFKKHKNSVEYNSVRLILLAKALFVICIGYLTRNSYLISTYTKAFRVAL